jgi:hypothetical protein
MSERDEQTRALFARLGPSENAKARMHAQIFRERSEDPPLPSLTEEWISLLRVRPVMHTALTFSAAAALLLGLPLWGLAQAFYALFSP